VEVHISAPVCDKASSSLALSQLVITQFWVVTTDEVQLLSPHTHTHIQFSSQWCERIEMGLWAGLGPGDVRCSVFSQIKAAVISRKQKQSAGLSCHSWNGFELNFTAAPVSYEDLNLTQRSSLISYCSTTRDPPEGSLISIQKKERFQSKWNWEKHFLLIPVGGGEGGLLRGCSYGN